MNKSCRFLTSIVSLCFVIASFSCSPLPENNVQTLPSAKDKVKLTLYYESLCPASMNFISRKLSPAYLKLSPYIDLDLVPYGNAQMNFSDGRWHFTCQHGRLECEYNKLHACALKTLNESTSFKLISCLMTVRNETLRLIKCATNYGVSLADLNACWNSSAADNYLSEYGDRTAKFTPPLDGVPTVVFNDVYSQDNEYEAFDDLSKILCTLLENKPTACTDIQQNKVAS